MILGIRNAVRVEKIGAELLILSKQVCPDYLEFPFICGYFAFILENMLIYVQS